MALETGTYISDLVSTNPTSGDPVSQADDHIRLVKATLLATFPNVTGAVTGTHTVINDAVQRVLTSGTAIASTSGTSIDFTGIPSWVSRVTVTFADVSSTGTSLHIVQIGDSGGIETSGYVSYSSSSPTGNNPTAGTSTAGFLLDPLWSAAAANSGSVVITRINAATNLWQASVVGGGNSGGSHGFHGGGSKTLSATLDRIRLTTVGGTDTFDTGTVNVLYE